MKSPFQPPAVPPPSGDRTLKQAELEAQRDFARLAHVHDISWSIDIFHGLVRYACSCDGRPRNAASLDTHILTKVKEARGPRPRTK